jgi:hypothetical protein
MAAVKYAEKCERARKERIPNSGERENLTEICMQGSLHSVE